MLDRIGELAEEHEATIINCGDTFHTRGIIRTACFDMLYRKYSDWKRKGLEQIILVGNHDQEDREGEIHPMRVFSKWKGWSVVDQECELPNHPKIRFFPYMKLDAIQKALTSNKWKEYDAIVHWGIRGAKRNDWNVDTDGVPVEWLTDFDRVFSGHYHFRSQFENVQYIGSPFQQNFGEMGQEKGVILYGKGKEKDKKESKKNGRQSKEVGKKGEVRFIEIEGTPKHFQISIKWEEGKKRVERNGGGEGEIQAQDFIRVKVEGEAEQVSGIDRNSLPRSIGDRGLTNIVFDRQVKDKFFSRLNIESKEVHDVEALMEKYVSFVESSLDKERLLTVGKELINA